ncbi:hypothetical protein [Kitasatospora phosalacinea]|uniref:DUF262 domain-containing protein n=1 Tax=Kitasatospora phosalacinea TaxID=2065 RepID=A0ABW6GQY4_9ACTN
MARLLACSIAQLVDRFDRGLLRFGYFRRPFRWEDEEVISFFDIILRGYPTTGMIMAEDADGSEFGVEGGESAEGVPWQVVDGAMRLEALLGALGHRAWSRSLEIGCDLDTEEVVDLRDVVDGDPVLPLRAVGSVNLLDQWLGDRPWLSSEQVGRAGRVASRILDYTIPVTVIGPIGDQELSEVFLRVNSGGRRLTGSEISHATRPRQSGASGAALRDVGRSSGFGLLGPEESAASVAVATADGAAEAFPVVISFLRDRAGVPHVRLLPKEDVIPVLIRFVARFGAPSGRAAEMLRRWVWRDAVTDGPRPADPLALVGPDPLSEALRLLESGVKSAAHWKPDLEAVDLRSAAGRVNALGMLSAHPTTLVAGDGWGPGVPVEDPRLLGDLLDSNADLLTVIVPDQELRPGGRHTLAGRLLHPATEPGRLREVIEAPDRDRAALAKHGLEPHAVDMLRSGRFDEFAGVRSEWLDGRIARHVQSYARWGFRDGRGLPGFGEGGEG